MSSKRQTTMAKLTRERKVREKREMKAEKKLAAAAVREAKANGTWVDPEEVLEENLEEAPDGDDRPVEPAA